MKKRHAPERDESYPRCDMGAGGYPDGALGRGITNGVRPAISGVCVEQLAILVGGGGDVFRLQPLHRGDDGASVAGGFFGLVA